MPTARPIQHDPKEATMRSRPALPMLKFALSLAVAPLAILAGAGNVAWAQPAGQPGGAAGAPPPAGPVSGADQVVGLFGATCLHYAGDVPGLRAFLQQQGAPAMPQQAKDAFLAGRPGQVFDVSYQTQKLALVSIDDGSCEAVADRLIRRRSSPPCSRPRARTVRPSRRWMRRQASVPASSRLHTP